MFDFDCTLSQCEGFVAPSLWVSNWIKDEIRKIQQDIISISVLVQSEDNIKKIETLKKELKNLSEAKMKEDEITYLMGGKPRLDAFKELYLIYKDQIQFVILTNNWNASKHIWNHDTCEVTDFNGNTRQSVLEMIRIMFPGFPDENLIFSLDEFVSSEKLQASASDREGGKGLAFRRWLETQKKPPLLSAPATHGGKRKVPKPIRRSKPRKTARRKMRKSKSRRARR